MRMLCQKSHPQPNQLKWYSKPVRPALTSFAVQLVKKQLVKEAESALKPPSDLFESVGSMKKVRLDV